MKRAGKVQPAESQVLFLMKSKIKQPVSYEQLKDRFGIASLYDKVSRVQFPMPLQLLSNSHGIEELRSRLLCSQVHSLLKLLSCPHPQWLKANSLQEKEERSPDSQVDCFPQLAMEDRQLL